MFKLDLEKAEEPEIKLPTSTGSLKKQENSRKHRLLLYWLCQSLWLCRSKQTMENSSRDGNNRPPYLFPEKLYASQEATVRTSHWTTDWFQIGQGVLQGCILSSCLFNLYAEYNIWSAELDEHKLESRLLGEISVTSDMQMIPLFRQKVKRNWRVSWWN